MAPCDLAAATAGREERMVPREKARADRAAAASIADQLAALQKMTVGQLTEKYLEVFGVPTRTRNGPYLRKRIGWQIQALAEGGLSERALARIAELAPMAPVRWRPTAPTGAPTAATVATPAQPATRDPRLPPPGTVLVRVHRGIEHQVTVLDDGFEYQGQRYRTLTQLARLITGTPWNGFLFWRLQRRGRTSKVGEPQR